MVSSGTWSISVPNLVENTSISDPNLVGNTSISVPNLVENTSISDPNVHPSVLEIQADRGVRKIRNIV